MGCAVARCEQVSEDVPERDVGHPARPRRAVLTPAADHLDALGAWLGIDQLGRESGPTLPKRMKPTVWIAGFMPP